LQNSKNQYDPAMSAVSTERVRRVPNPLKWHGGKYYLAPKIVALMPPHIHYVEPFAGGLSVLLSKNPDEVSEVVNDLHRDLTNFWNVLKSESDFAKFHRIVETTPFSQVEWESAREKLELPDPAERAAAFFVLCRQSLSGRMAQFAPLTRNRLRRRMNEQVSAWINAVEGLPAVHARLRRVVILNRPAVEVIQMQEGPNTLFYLDPPYMHETRYNTDEYGDHEMSSDDHRELLECLSRCKGKFMISMYMHQMYDDFAKRCGWNRFDFDLPNNAAGGASKRRMMECVWMNFKPGKR
jgi:DNA adenine methylase